MIPIIFLVGALGIGFVVLKLTAPRRAFVAEHIEPIQADVRLLKTGRAKLLSKKQKLKDELFLYSRDFEAEIAKERKRKHQGYEQMASLKEEISDAYEDLNEAKDDLNSWYRKSERSFFGNGGKKIEKSTWFSQSLNQRDSLKGDRDSAFRRVQQLKSEKDTVYENSVGAAKDRLKEINEDKAKLKSFLETGRTQKVIQSDINALQSRVEELHIQIVTHEARMSAKWEEYNRGKGQS